MSIDVALCDRSVLSRFILKRYHPTTDTEMELGVAVEEFLMDTENPEKIAIMRKLYLSLMVSQGFSEERINTHLDAFIIN